MKHGLLFVLCAMVVNAMAQSMSFYQDPPNTVEESEAPAPRVVKGRWCSLGTSITWVNDHNEGLVEKGYQTRVMERLAFTRHINRAVNGGRVASAIPEVVRAEYYTIEHGINDWGGRVLPGTFEDYRNDTRNGTFAASYRMLIDAIFHKNPRAKVVLCTPRKAYGYNGTFPDNPNDALSNGYTLKDYVDIVRQIAEYESFPVADFYTECGGGRLLTYLSTDKALHPNDAGYQLMANVLVQALEKVIVDE
ncbi:MAG: SGNH/GDSL hydrolase family protein [Bacteroidaceae bacterium]|nr:SGNH/GDSL hydrolase family protein [Bacteroidaceae bacterium]